jgi:hypothetical protein
MKRAERRALAKRTGEPFVRLPGSLKPFHRLHTLLEEAKKAARARMSAIERMQTLFSKGFWSNFVEVLLPKLEKKRQAALESTREQFSAQDAALLKAGKKLLAYKSRGHGKGGYSPRFGKARSKYMPHQGERERARRQRFAVFTAISAWRWSFARDLRDQRA